MTGLTAEATAIALRAAIGGLLLLAVFRLVYRRAAVEAFRQEVFALRRELFMLVADGRIAPATPAYERLRRTLNFLIHGASEVTFSRYLIAVFTMVPADVAAYDRQMKAWLAEVPPDARQVIKGIRHRMGNAMIRHALRISPSAWLFIAVAVLPGLAMAAIRGSWKRVTEPVVDRTRLTVETLSVASC